MSDETGATQEIPVEEDDLRGQSVALDRDGHPRIVPPVGAALSVLWWPDDEPGSSR